ncbi:MAG: Tetratricopeptide 2 repeat protein, partial [Bacilli bacterium]|nr:Tetratricopeptide 2 repeat protein [Bacilli bacterium]
LLLRRGLFQESELYFRKAIETATTHNTNLYDSEPHYNLGLTLRLQGRLDEAYNSFYKATWSAAWQDKGFYFLAQIACAKADLEDALELIDKSIMKNYRNYRARNLKSAILRKMGKWQEAEQFTQETIRFDITDFGARNEMVLISRENGNASQVDAALQELAVLMRKDPHNYIALAQEYAESGLYTEAVDVLSRILQESTVYPMVYYYLSDYENKRGHNSIAERFLTLGQEASSDYCFPNQLSDLIVLTNAVQNHTSSKAHYYLGNLLYDKKRHIEAVGQWEESINLDPSFATVYRNLALAYYNKLNDVKRAQQALETAFGINKNDARVYYELDQLYKKIGIQAEERLYKLKQHLDLVRLRDDLYIEYVTLLNTLGQYKEAQEWLAARKFHPWEGGEGKVSSQYVLCHVELAKKFLLAEDYAQASVMLEQAKRYPENIGEGKLTGAQENHINYYLGLAYAGLGKEEQAKHALELGSQGLDEPTSAMFYNDQPPEMIYYQGMCSHKLGQEEQARGKFNKLVDYGEKHLFQTLKIDFFAVSLPDFLVFDEELNRKNEVHCRYMTALGYLGLGKAEQAMKQFRHVLQIEPSHQGAMVHLQLF